MGARLMAALKRKARNDLRFAGVGGDRMAAEGLRSLFPITELSIMGAAELLPRARRMLGLVDATARAALDAKPSLIVTVDSWGFSARVASRLKGRDCPLVQFVAPKAWAWRPGRARNLAKLVDHLIVQLPFEPAFFDRYGVATSYVGHPIVESGIEGGDGRRFRSTHGIAEDQTLLCVLPGSRRTEVEQLLPVFSEVAAALAGERPGMRLVVPTVSTVEARVRDAVAHWPGSPIVFLGDDEKYDALAAANAALAASGTVSLELAIAGLPAVIAYRMNPLSAAIARLLITVKYANLVNIILDRPIVPEFIQGRCRPDLLVPAMKTLLDIPDAAAEQRAVGAHIAETLGLGGRPPSDRAADVLWAMMRQGDARAAIGNTDDTSRQSDFPTIEDKP